MVLLLAGLSVADIVGTRAAVFEKIASAFPTEEPQSVSSSSVLPTVIPSTSTPVGCCVVTPANPQAQPASQYFLASNHPPPPPPVPTT